MDYESKIIEFLSQKENIQCALEIADRIEQVKDSLQEDFWKKLADKFVIDFDSYINKNLWKISLQPDTLKNVRKNNIGLCVKYRDADNLNISLELLQENTRLWLNIPFNKDISEIKNIVSIKEINDIQNKMIEDKFNQKIIGSQAGWKWTEYYLRNKDFLLTMANDCNIFPDEVSSWLYSECDIYLPLLEKANDVIKKLI